MEHTLNQMLPLLCLWWNSYIYVVRDAHMPGDARQVDRRRSQGGAACVYARRYAHRCRKLAAVQVAYTFAEAKVSSKSLETACVGRVLGLEP